MTNRSISYETREEFFELLAGGVPVSVAAAAVGVSREAGAAWWRKSGPMDLQLQTGARGGLPGDAPTSHPGEPSVDDRRVGVGFAVRSRARTVR